MNSFELTLKFLDQGSCTDFHNKLSQSELEQDTFDIALPDSRFNFDNDTLSIVVTFVQHGGLEAVANVAALFKAVLDHIPPPKSADPVQVIRITTKAGDEIEISSDMSTEQILELMNAYTFRKY